MEGYYYGILDVYYAIMKTEDTATAAPTYEVPAVLAKSIEVTITPAYREGKLYASNATVRDKKKIDSYGVKLNVDKIPARMQKIPSRPAVSASIVGSSSVPIPRKSYVRRRNTCLPEI